MTSDNPALSYKDRRGGLIFFGILQVGLGLLAMMMTALISLSLLIPHRAGVAGPALHPRLIVPAVVIYLGTAVWFIVLGIAAMLPRRWAWALILVHSWIWLAFGMMTGVMTMLLANSFMPPMPPGSEGARTFALGCMAVVFAVFCAILPLIFVLFFRSPNVKATVFARDPKPRWTDPIPLPVLGGGLLLIGGAVMILMMSVSYSGFPLGSTVIRGWGAVALLVVLSALSAFSGVQLLRLEKSGWWATVLFVLVGAVYAGMFINTDAAVWREVIASDLPAKQIETMAGLYRSPLFLGWMAIMWIAYAVYLGYIRRYFFGQNALRT